MTDLSTKRTNARARIVDSAARLMREAGPEAVTTRRVAERAGVQPPAIYRLFVDKEGLLEAVAEHVMADFASSKALQVESATARGVDPLEDLRAAWRAQIDFGVANPALFRLLSDPDRVRRSAAARLGREALQARIRRVAITGRLRVSEPRAVAMIQAAGTGVIQTLLATLPDDRDPGLADAMYDSILAQILTDAPRSEDDGTMATTIAFRAIAPQLTALSDAERQLLDDWLARVTDGR